jgi:hypothetical protein
LWVQAFETVEELRQALQEFKERFNRHGLLQRHGYATPSQVRAAPHAPGGSSMNFVQNSVQYFGGFTKRRSLPRHGITTCGSTVLWTLY